MPATACTFLNRELKQHEFHSIQDLAQSLQRSTLNQDFPDFRLDVSFSNKSFLCLFIALAHFHEENVAFV